MLGEKLKQRREELGLSRNALARQAGVTHQYIRKLEMNSVAHPSYSKLKAVSTALGIGLENLVGEGSENEEHGPAQTARNEMAEIAREIAALSPADQRLVRTLIQRLLHPP